MLDCELLYLYTIPLLLPLLMLGRRRRWSIAKTESDHCKGPSGEVASFNRIADCQLNRDIMNLQTTGLDETRI